MRSKLEVPAAKLAPPVTKVARARTRAPRASEAAGPGVFRRLKWNELVSQGDFVANGRQGFELWEGPGGFRAHSFVKPIYRRDMGGAIVAKATA